METNTLAESSPIELIQTFSSYKYDFRTVSPTSSDTEYLWNIARDLMFFCRGNKSKWNEFELELCWLNTPRLAAHFVQE